MGQEAVATGTSEKWRALSLDHIPSRGFKRVGVMKPKQDFTAISFSNGEFIGYGCTAKCCGIITALVDVDDYLIRSNLRVVLRSIKESDRATGVKLDNREVKCSLGCDPYSERFNNA